MKSTKLHVKYAVRSATATSWFPTMELRRVGDALLRSQTSPLVFLVPAISSRSQTTTYRTANFSQRRQLQHASATSNSQTGRRYIATSATNTSTAPSPKSLSPSPSLDWLSPGTAKKRSGLYPRESILRSSPEDQALLNNGNSADDLLSSLNKMARGPGTSGSDAAGLNSSSIPLSSKTGYQVMQDMNKALSDAMPAREKLSLSPRTGRTIHVLGNVDVGRGFRILGQSCARNKIKQDFAYQRFHERPGLKRKRLKSKRWRKRFMLAFRTTVTRVKQLTAQGW